MNLLILLESYTYIHKINSITNPCATAVGSLYTDFLFIQGSGTYFHKISQYSYKVYTLLLQPPIWRDKDMNTDCPYACRRASHQLLYKTPCNHVSDMGGPANRCTIATITLSFILTHSSFHYKNVVTSEGRKQAVNKNHKINFGKDLFLMFNNQPQVVNIW